MPTGPGSGHYLSTETAALISAYVVDASNDPSTGDTVVARVRSKALGWFLDFDDDTFKAAGHTTISLTLSQLDATNAPGSYDNTVDISAITNLSANDTLTASILVTTGKNAPPVELRIDQWVSDVLNYAAYQGAIWLDATNGSVGAVTGVNGVVDSPTTTITSARTLAEAIGIRRVNIRTGSHALTAASYANYFFDGQGDGAIVTATSATELGGADFRNVTVAGTVTSGGTAAHARGCTMNGASWPGGDIWDSLISGTLTINNGTTGTTNLINCRSLEVSGNRPIIDLNSLARAVQLRGWQGDLTISNLDQGGAELNIELDGGHITFDASCTAGTVIVRGVGGVTNAGSVTVVTTDLMTALDLQMLRALKDRYAIDGGAGNADLVVDGGNAITAGRIRYFPTSALAAAATAGAANDADSETGRIDLAGTMQDTGVLGNGTQVTG